ncbi:hypothetical protein BDW59DRAFT_148909 [Aspergillus cavernicola]|uniref:Uncharacterized protein n=1 Tax=Aspergillus cavernicola TaxID=176166 RepID=A0ABR4I674_9EURO
MKGYENSPRNLVENFMLHSIPTSSETRQIRGISHLYLLRGNMAAFAGRAKVQEFKLDTRFGVDRCLHYDMEFGVRKTDRYFLVCIRYGNSFLGQAVRRISTRAP